MMEENNNDLALEDKTADKKYFTIIPNYILNHSTIWDREIYIQMKRIAGEDGQCWIGQRNLAKRCNVSRPRLCKSLKYLLEHEWIKKTGQKGINTLGGKQLVDEYIICDLWQLNSDFYKQGGKREIPPKVVNDRVVGKVVNDAMVGKVVNDRVVGREEKEIKDKEEKKERTKEKKEETENKGKDREFILLRKNVKENYTTSRVCKIPNNHKIIKQGLFGPIEEWVGYDWENILSPLMDKFKSVNPNFSVLYKIKSQRSALERLFDLHGEEKLTNLLNMLPQIINMPYAPIITTPCQLEMKLGQLLAFMQKEKNKPKKPFYQDMPMVQKGDKWYVIQDGQWLEYCGKESEIVYK